MSVCLLEGWLGFLRDEVNVHFGMLIVFEMAADAAMFVEHAQEFRDAKRGVIQRLAVAWVGHFSGVVKAARGEDQDAARIQRVAQLAEDLPVRSERHVPDAVPRRDEIVSRRECMRADVRLVKRHARMFLPGEHEHFGRQIELLHLKAMIEQELNDSPAAAATDIERAASLRHEADGPFVLGDAVLRVKIVTRPMMRDTIVTSCYFFGAHTEKWLARRQLARRSP